MRIVFSALLAGALVASCGQKSATSTETTQETTQEKPQVEDLVAENVDVDQFAKLVAAGEGQLVDVRTPDEYAEGHIAGAANMDIYSETFESSIATLDKETPVYVYCRSGGRSGIAMKIMNDMGFKNVYNLDGGMSAWSGANQPVEK
jgi:rhodanese-related sulfurtransferase